VTFGEEVAEDNPFDGYAIQSVEIAFSEGVCYAGTNDDDEFMCVCLTDGNGGTTTCTKAAWDQVQTALTAFSMGVTDFGLDSVTASSLTTHKTLLPDEDHDEDLIRIYAGMKVGARNVGCDGVATTCNWVAAAVAEAELKGAVSGLVFGATALLAVASVL